MSQRALIGSVAGGVAENGPAAGQPEAAQPANKEVKGAQLGG